MVLETERLCLRRLTPDNFANLCRILHVEGQSVGPEDAPMAVHQVLLRAGVVLLEGIRYEVLFTWIQQAYDFVQSK